jgi:folate-dependent phosphoribosylglycinamide formyltransferase PurN
MEKAEKWGLVVSVFGLLVDAGVAIYQARQEKAEQERLDDLEERVQALEKPRRKRRPKQGDAK